MTSGKQLYRSCRAPLGGVCAGVADYFGMDAIVARIATVAGTVLSGGLLGVAYIAMVVVVPKAPDCTSCYDVRPQSAVSDKTGPIPLAQMRSRSDYRTSSRGNLYRRTYCEVGHTPPEPPEGIDFASDDGFAVRDFYQVK